FPDPSPNRRVSVAILTEDLSCHRRERRRRSQFAGDIHFGGLGKAGVAEIPRARGRMSAKPVDNTGEDSARSRYPGTRPFRDTPEDYERFFGRNREGEQLYLRVLSVPLLVQFGKSGLGKTSLLQASLFPRLRQKAYLPVMIRLNITGDTFTQ